MHKTILAILLPIIAFSQAVPFQKTDNALLFGGDALHVAFSPQDGSIQKLEYNGQTIAVAQPTTPWMNIKGEDGSWLPENSQWTLQNAVQTADDTLRLDVVCGNWSVHVFTQILLEKKQLRRWFEIAWTGDKPSKIRHFQQRWFRIPMAEGMFYNLPANRTTIEEVSFQNLTDHAVHRAGNGSRVCIFQLSGTCSLLFLTNELATGFDRGNTTLENRDDAVDASLFADIQGHMQPNVYQPLGEYWLWLQDNHSEIALTRIHEWHRDRGLVPPADRPDWVRRATLYSFHPKGSIGSLWSDWGGFAPSIKQLDRIAELGCNAIWLLPLEDLSCYWPRDYYKFQDGLGTPEEYKQLVDRAHELGMHVLQDIVPHGGSNTYPRAQQHPEWLLQQEDGSTLHYWCFDFNWPSWIDYMKDVARHYVKTYGIDGYRIDACGSSKTPNWNPDIPYSRASQSMTPGGINMQKAIRDGSREFNPAAATLAETGSNVFGSISDCLYDFTFCYDMMQGLRKRNPETFAKDLRRWLHEQQCTDLPGQIRLRHIESHDSLRAEYWYGPDGMRRAMAISAWIPGIPMVYQDMEDGHGYFFKKVFKIRNSLVEMGDGDADYLAVNTPDDVFAVLRTANQPVNPPEQYAWDKEGEGPRASIAVVGLSPYYPDPRQFISIDSSKLPEPFRQATQVYDVLNGKVVNVHARHTTLLEKEYTFLELPMPESGMAVYRFGGAPEKLKPEPPSFIENHGNQRLAIKAFAIGNDGKRTPLPDFTQFDSKSTNIGNGLLLRLDIPEGMPCDWAASAANGVWFDRFRTRHPLCNGVVRYIYYMKQGGNVLWNSLFWPFGLSPHDANITFATQDGSITLHFNPQSLPAAVFLLDRVGDDHVPHVFIAEKLDEVPEFGTCPFTLELQPSSFSHKAQLDTFWKSMPGQYVCKSKSGWEKIRIGRNGSLLEWSTGEHHWGGMTYPLISEARLYTDAGFGEDRLPYSANDAAEPFTRITRMEDGAIRLQFLGTMRGFNRFNIMVSPIDYYTEYHIHEDLLSIGFVCGIRNRQPAAGSRSFTAWMATTCFQNPYTATMFNDDGILQKGESDTKRSMQTKGTYNPFDIKEIRFHGKEWKGNGVGEFFNRDFRLRDINWQSPVPPANVFLHNKNFFIAWHDGPPQENDAYGQWCFFSTRLTTHENDGSAPEISPFAKQTSVKLSALQNPDFEENVDRQWLKEIVQFFPHNTSWNLPKGAALDTMTAHSGKTSLRIEGYDGEYRLVRQTIPLAAMPVGSVWKASCWVKSDNIQPGTIGWMNGTLRLELFREGKPVEYRSIAFPREAFDWKQFSVELTVPEGLTNISIAAGLNGNRGKIWIDDFSLERIDTPPNNKEK
ncbi:MAG: hypothetical protein IKZ46_05840 [Victivallales bacterium]|nr:hypothetical protein [Victivallales bacterium]